MDRLRKLKADLNGSKEKKKSSIPVSPNSSLGRTFSLRHHRRIPPQDPARPATPASFAQDSSQLLSLPSSARPTTPASFAQDSFRPGTPASFAQNSTNTLSLPSSGRPDSRASTAQDYYRPDSRASTAQDSYRPSFASSSKFLLEDSNMSYNPGKKGFVMPGIQSFRNVSLPFGKSRREVEPDEETKPREMTEAEKVAAFEAWSKQLLESIEAKGNYFVACTPEQLTELEPEGLEKSRVVKAYIGPSTTPYPELESDAAAGRSTSQAKNRPGDSAAKHGKRPENQAANVEVVFGHVSEHEAQGQEPAERRRKAREEVDAMPHPTEYKTIAEVVAENKRHQGLRSHGIQVLAIDPAKMYESEDNHSDYYGMPVIESPNAFTAWDTDLELAESKYKKDKKRKAHKVKINTIYDNSDDEDPKDKPNEFYPMHSQIASHSLILHLAGRGNSGAMIGTLLGPLHETFIFRSESRYFRGLRIPEHWQFTPSSFATVMQHCKMDFQKWQRERDELGKIPQELRDCMMRRRKRVCTYLAKDVFENYLYWRCMRGQRYHKRIEIPGLDLLYSWEDNVALQ